MLKSICQVKYFAPQIFYFSFEDVSFSSWRTKIPKYYFNCNEKCVLSGWLSYLRLFTPQDASALLPQPEGDGVRKLPPTASEEDIRPSASNRKVLLIIMLAS